MVATQRGTRSCWVLAMLLVTLPATAQDAVTAEALFRKGVAEMLAGDYASGCTRIGESFRLDPQPGALFALADCESRWGKVATALAHFEDYLGLVQGMTAGQKARQRDRVSKAKAEIAKLKPKVPELILVLPRHAPPETVVERDGVALGAAALGVGLPVDPGEHEVTTRVGDGPIRTTRFTLEPGEKRTVELEVEVPPPPKPPPKPKAKPAAARPVPAAVWVAGGVGAAGLLVGSVTGVVVLSKKASIDDNCEGHACNPEGKRAADSAQAWATVSTLSFAIGVAGAGTAVVLLLTRPKSTGGPESARWQVSAGLDASAAWAGARRSW